MGRSSKATYAHLYDVASRQQGFFSTRQALLAGYTDNVHPYHVRNGDWRRVHRGIYRLNLFPESPSPRLMVIWLWSHNRAGIPQGVFSHQTARALLDDEPSNDAEIHLTVPRLFRRKPGNLPVSLHHDDLSLEDYSPHAPFSVTTERRTRQDLGHPMEKETPLRPRPKVASPASQPTTPDPEGRDWAAWS